MPRWALLALGCAALGETAHADPVLLASREFDRRRPRPCARPLSLPAPHPPPAPARAPLFLFCLPPPTAPRLAPSPPVRNL